MAIGDAFGLVACRDAVERERFWRAGYVERERYAAIQIGQVSNRRVISARKASPFRQPENALRLTARFSPRRLLSQPKYDISRKCWRKVCDLWSDRAVWKLYVPKEEEGRVIKISTKKTR